MQHSQHHPLVKFRISSHHLEVSYDPSSHCITVYIFQKPGKDEWINGLSALKDALQLEHFVNDKLLDLHWLAQQRNDPHVSL